MSVDTRSETVLTAAHNLRNQVIPPEAHRTFAADLLRALLTERDEALVKVREFEDNREFSRQGIEHLTQERDEAIRQREAAGAAVQGLIEDRDAWEKSSWAAEARAATAEARVQELEAEVEHARRQYRPNWATTPERLPRDAKS